MPLSEISQVIAKLDYIIEWSKIHKSPLGYFAALYQRTTIEVERAIDNGFFDYPDLVTELDVRFAEYYLRAFEKFMRRDPYISSSWLFAFKMAEKQEIAVLQHLLNGMNAHINLDLGVSLALIAKTRQVPIEDLKHDFYRINQILYSLVDQMQDKISEIWGPLKILDYMMGRVDEKIVEWILRYFRNQAWAFANRLVEADDEEHEYQLMEEMDAKVEGIARRISFPIATKFNPLYYAILTKENRNVAEIIELLHEADIYTKW